MAEAWLTVGERHGLIGHEQPECAERHEPGIGRKAREHVVRLDAVASQETRDQPRAR